MGTSAEYTAFKKLVQEKIMKSKNERSMAQCVAEVRTAAATPLDSGFQGGMRGNETLESEVQDSHHISNLPPIAEEGSDSSTESEKQNDEKQKGKAKAKKNINTKAIKSDQEEVQRDPSVKANINAKVVKEDQEEVQDPSAKEDQDDPEAVKAKRYVRHIHTELVC